MSLSVHKVSFHHYRNLKQRQLCLGPHITILVGPNATGKTNTIEALEYLTGSPSFRHPASVELIERGYDAAHVTAQLTGDGRVVDIQITVVDGKKKFLLNGKPCRGRDLSSTLMSVLFCPDDLSLVKGSASQRRNELDAFGSQANRAYRGVLSTYTRSIEQRNRLLRDGCEPALLDAWDESVAVGGATLLYHRLRLFERLSELVTSVYHDIVSTETLSCHYVASIAPSDEDGIARIPDRRALTELTRDELTDVMAEQLKLVRDDDLRHAQTHVGPHRDDISFLLDGHSARNFGSQGQQRSIVLAWKMAEVCLCEQVLDMKPLLLLDDVMSELDAQRRACVTRFVNQGIQTVITTTNLGYFTDEILSSSTVIPYGTQERDSSTEIPR